MGLHKERLGCVPLIADYDMIHDNEFLSHRVLSFFSTIPIPSLQCHVFSFTIYSLVLAPSELNLCCISQVWALNIFPYLDCLASRLRSTKLYLTSSDWMRVAGSRSKSMVSCGRRGFLYMPRCQLVPI